MKQIAFIAAFVFLLFQHGPAVVARAGDRPGSLLLLILLAAAGAALVAHVVTPSPPASKKPEQERLPAPNDACDGAAPLPPDRSSDSDDSSRRA